MAERKRFTDIIFNRDNTEEKRLNTFRDEDSLYNNLNFIQGYNNRSGAWRTNRASKIVYSAISHKGEQIQYIYTWDRINHKSTAILKSLILSC